MSPAPARATASSTSWTSSDWFRCRQPRPHSRMRLICLPHAGGAAGFFSDWSATLPAEVEVQAVQYPGRADRIADPCIDSMDELAPALAQAIRPLADRPIAMFGHSMGAAVAYEVTRLLQDWGIRPVHLFVSGRHSPGEVVPGEVHRRDDDGLVADLVRLGGTAAELLSSPELRAFFLPAIRSDYRLAETYRWSPGAEPECPLTVLLGDADPEVTYAQAERWAAHAPGGIRIRQFPGDHFYLVPERAAVLDLVMSSS